MRKLFILASLIIASIFTTAAQETVNNFSTDNGKLIWQKVFETKLDFDQLTDKIIESGIFEEIDRAEDKILGQTIPINADFKGAGYSEMLTPMYIARSFIDGFAVIEFKDGKYRVTLKNIFLTQEYNDGLSELNEKTTIETFGVKNGKSEMKRAFIKSPSEILDYTFTKSFNFNTSDRKDDW